MSSQQPIGPTHRLGKTKPLNLTKREIEFLWEEMKEIIGKEEVQYSDDRQTAEHIHTKLRRLHYSYPDHSEAREVYGGEKSQ